MGYVVVHQFPGATEEQYNASKAAVHPPNGLPDGQLLHLAGPSEDGWAIVAVHDSKQGWETFRAELMAKMAKGIDGGFTTPPQETTFEVRNLERHSAHTVIRRYEGAGADALFTALETREPEIRDIMASVPGFVSYTAFRTGGQGGLTITTCDDKTGTDESSRRAAAWVKDNIDVAVETPITTEGDTLLQF